MCLSPALQRFITGSKTGKALTCMASQRNVRQMIKAVLSPMSVREGNHANFLREKKSIQSRHIHAKYFNLCAWPA